MSEALAAVVAVVAMAIVIWPFVRASAKGETPGVDAGEAEAYRRARADVYQEIRQLEADRASGLVEDEDYRTQRQDLRLAAARVMQAEARSAPSDREERLEREIAAARRTRGQARPE